MYAQLCYRCKHEITGREKYFGLTILFFCCTVAVFFGTACPDLGRSNTTNVVCVARLVTTWPPVLHLALLLFAGLLREERVRKKTESKQKGRKKVLPVRKSKFGQKKKKSRRWLLRKAEKTGESVQNQSRSQKDRKQNDRWWEKKLDAVAKLRFSGEAGPLPFLQKGTFVWPFLHARLRQLSLQLELLQQTVFCNEFDQGSAQEFGTVFHGYIVAYDFANLCCCLWGCGCCGFVQNSWWSDSQTATSLFKYLRAHEAQRGSEINDSTRLRGHVEVDAHKVRTAWISKKTTKYRNQVAALQLKHPAPRINS